MKKFPVRHTLYPKPLRLDRQIRCGYVYAVPVHHYPRSPKFIFQIYEPEGNEHFIGTRADVVREIRKRNRAFCERNGVEFTP